MLDVHPVVVVALLGNGGVSEPGAVATAATTGVGTAEFCMMTEGPLSALSLGSLTAAIRMITMMITRMTAPPEPRRGTFSESNESRIDEVEVSSKGSMEILLLTNSVSLTLSF